jgi:hypothetical protein
MPAAQFADLDVGDPHCEWSVNQRFKFPIEQPVSDALLEAHRPQLGRRTHQKGTAAGLNHLE